MGLRGLDVDNPAGDRSRLLIAAIGCAAFLVIFFLLGSVGDDGSSSSAQFADGDDAGPLPMWVVLGGALIGGGVIGMTSFALIGLLRRDRPAFDELPPQEQDRRHEAGRLLRGDTSDAGADEPR